MKQVKKAWGAASVVVGLCCFTAFASQKIQGYMAPPPPIEEILRAPKLPHLAISPDREWALVTEQAATVGIEQLSRASISLWGRDYDAAGRPVSPFYWRGVQLNLVDLTTGDARTISGPRSGMGDPVWSPNGRHFVLSQATPTGSVLWVGDKESLAMRRVEGARLKGERFDNDACVWLPNGDSLICRFEARGEDGVVATDEGVISPIRRESKEGTSGTVVYGGNLQNEMGERTYKRIMTSQAGVVDVRTLQIRNLGEPAIYEYMQPSPDGRLVLLSRIVPPYSWTFEESYFPRLIEVIRLSDGSLIKEITRQDPDESGFISKGWARRGPRRFTWVPGEPSTLSYIESSGAPAKESGFLDRLMVWRAPFTAPAEEVFRTKARMIRYPSLTKWADGQGNLGWLRDGSAWIEDFDPATYQKKTWIVPRLQTGNFGAARLLFTGSSKEARRIGKPVVSETLGDDSVVFGSSPAVLEGSDECVYMIGETFSSEGDRPYLDCFDVKNGGRKRLFESGEEEYAMPSAPVGHKRDAILVRAESGSEPANFELRIKNGDAIPITHRRVPLRRLVDSKIVRLNYKRSDGRSLSGDLFLPANYRDGSRIPVVIYAYPTRLPASQQVPSGRTRVNRYLWGDDQTPFLLPIKLLTTQGYGVLWYPSMPVFGDERANDSAAHQLVDNAEAAKREMVRLGIADPGRVAIAGHSYGATMVVTILANSDEFSTGIALSGAYNHVNTPFGFQEESRSYWNAKSAYNQLSGLQDAEKINEPLLLVHGDRDMTYGISTAGTRSFFQALDGLGHKAKLIELPFEGHGYNAIESQLEVASQIIEWLDLHLDDRTSTKTKPNQSRTAPAK